MIETKDDDYKKYIYYLNNFYDFNYVEGDFITNYKFQKKYNEIIKKYKIDFLYDEKFEYKMSKLARFIYLFVPANKPLITNPCDYNGFELLDLCLSGFSLNCTGYSIILNDILLTLNIKSKCIWGLSHIIGDDECHAFNHVYNEKEDKWIVVDPAFGCVPCNNEDKGLNIIEFRSAIANQDDLKLIKNPNYKHNESYTHNYRKYISKNLFMFLTLQNSGLEYITSKGILVKPNNFTIDSDYYDCHYITNNIYYLFK